VSPPPTRDVVGEALLDRRLFLGLQDSTYLFTAAEGPALQGVAAALAHYVDGKSRGAAGRQQHFEAAATCRAAVAALAGAREDEFALVPSASAGVSAVVAALGLKPGDSVVVNDLEFPSVVLPFLRRREEGLEVRVVRHRDWSLDTDQILAAVDETTRVVAISHVSYVNGLRHDLKAIREGLSGSNAALIVDATQSLGVLEVDLQQADFLVASGYKWLMGIHGLGVLYWNRTRRPEFAPRDAGPSSVEAPYGPDRYGSLSWKESAARFELGFPAFPPMYALAASVPLLAGIGARRSQAHALELGSRLLRGLLALRVRVLTPSEPNRRGASISFAHHKPEELARLLAEQGVHVWGGDGRVRASTHVFNDKRDVDTFLERTESMLGQLR
jgi:cysteine desulfurase/selenocysteine lyase